MLTSEQFAVYEQKGGMPELSARLLYNSTARRTYIAIESKLSEAAQKRFVGEFSGPQLFYGEKQALLHLFDFDQLEPLPDEPLSEGLFWDVMARLVDFFARLKRCGLVISEAKTELIFVRRGSYQICAQPEERSVESSLRHVEKDEGGLGENQDNYITCDNPANFLVFASFEGLREASQSGDFEQDVLELGKIAFRLFCRGKIVSGSSTSPTLFSSQPCTFALKALLAALLAPPPTPRISVEELESHPLLVMPDEKSLQMADELKIEDFNIVKEIGRGAFGRAFLAEYLPSGEEVALKSCANSSLERSEAALLAKSLHPHVVRCFGRVKDGTEDYLALEYCSGGDLFVRIEKDKIPKDMAFRWICQLSSALYYMHSVNVMHRDVKLENILIDGEDAFFTDFNASKSVSLTTRSVVGTPLYYSPEQYFKLEYSKSADVFGMGLVFFDILVGKHPFSSEPEDVAKFFARVKRCGGVGCDAISDPELKPIVAEMLRYDPKTRFSAADVCAEPEIFKFLVENSLPVPSCAWGSQPVETPKSAGKQTRKGLEWDEEEQVQIMTVAMPMTPRAISGSSAFEFESALAAAEIRAMSKFGHNAKLLAELLPAALSLAQAYVFHITRAKQSKYAAYACYKAATAISSRYNVVPRKYDIFEPQAEFSDENCAFQLGKLLQSFQSPISCTTSLTGASFVGLAGASGAASAIAPASISKTVALAFSAAFLAPNSVKIRARAAVLCCGRLIIEDEGLLTINIRNCSKFAIYCGKIKGKIELQIEGTCEVEVYGEVEPGQIIGVHEVKKKDELAEFDEKISCLAELLTVCYPALMKDAGWTAQKTCW